MSRHQIKKARAPQIRAKPGPKDQASATPPQWKKHLLTAAALLLLSGAAFAATYFMVRLSQPSASDGMVWIAGGEFTMGTDDERGWADEKPAHRVRVAGFWMDETEVTNGQFRAFVDATGYVTTAEKKPVWEELRKQLPPDAPRPPDSKLVPG